MIRPESGAHSGARGVLDGLPEPIGDAAAVLADAWPTLSDPVKARILAMIEASRT